MRVIIIGSGIAGLSTAIALRKVGIESVVYDRSPELREVGAGISLWANALKALNHLGAMDAVRKIAQPLVLSEFRLDEGRKVKASFLANQFERAVGYSPIGAMVHRADLVLALAGFLPPNVARYGFECVKVDHWGDRVAVGFANGHSDEADAVVGADGVKSFVRTAIFGREEPRYAGYTCWRGLCPRPASVEPGYLGEWWGRGKRFGITTLTNGLSYWFAVQNASPGQYPADNLSVVEGLFKGWAHPVSEMISSTPPDRLIQGDILDRPPTRTWSKGRVGLVGDAAHPTTPNLGQGGCMAIEDAVALARAMSRHRNPADAFMAFTAERFRRTAGVTHESWRFGKVGQMEGRLACWVRDAVIGLLMPLTGIRGLIKHASFDVGPLST